MFQQHSRAITGGKFLCWSFLIFIGIVGVSAPAAAQDDAPASAQEIAQYKRGAAAGDAKAELNLGRAYYFGEGIEQDYAQAAFWLGKSAEQGDSAAQFGLGNLYLQGRGVAQSGNQAIAWFLKSAAQGNADAQMAMGLLYLNGRLGLPRDRSNAEQWLRMAAGNGSQEAQEILDQFKGH